MKDDLMQFLIDFAWDHNIGVEIGEFGPNFRARTLPEYNLVIVNTNWHNHNEVPFSFAHELGHIMNRDTGIRYYESETVKDKSEYQANLFGIGLLLQFCKRNGFAFDNSVKFCEVFGIPIELEYIVNLKLKEIM